MREIRASTQVIAPRLGHIAVFDITYWYFTIAYSFQNATLKTFIIMAVFYFQKLIYFDDLIPVQIIVSCKCL